MRAAADIHGRRHGGGASTARLRVELDNVAAIQGHSQQVAGGRHERVGRVRAGLLDAHTGVGKVDGRSTIDIEPVIIEIEHDCVLAHSRELVGAGRRERVLLARAVAGDAGDSVVLRRHGDERSCGGQHGATPRTDDHSGLRRGLVKTQRAAGISEPDGAARAVDDADERPAVDHDGVGRDGHRLGELRERRVNAGHSLRGTVNDEHVVTVLQHIEGCRGNGHRAVQLIDLPVEAPCLQGRVVGHPDIPRCELDVCDREAGMHDGQGHRDNQNERDSHPGDKPATGRQPRRHSAHGARLSLFQASPHSGQRPKFGLGGHNLARAELAWFSQEP